jgi:predicted alpha/beta superfamily hydrolase
MKPTTIIRAAFTFAILVFCAFLTAIPGNAQKIIKASIKSEILGQERIFGIHLPKNYDAGAKKKYPVIYALDGFKQLALKFDALSEDGRVPETIVVGIADMGDENRQKDSLPPYMKSDLEKENSPMGRGDKFLKFIETELMPYMEKNYKVSGVNAISGHSRGGVLVIYSLLANPGLFQARFAFSPAVWREDNLLVVKTKEFLASPNKKKSFFYMTMGTAEVDKMKGAFDALTETFTKNPPKKIVWHSEYTKDATHQTNVELSISKALEKWAEYLK